MGQIADQQATSDFTTEGIVAQEDVSNSSH
jgi:hypothetical protein